MNHASDAWSMIHASREIIGESILIAECIKNMKIVLKLDNAIMESFNNSGNFKGSEGYNSKECNNSTKCSNR